MSVNLPPGFGPEPTPEEIACADKWHQAVVEGLERRFIRGSFRLAEQNDCEELSRLIVEKQLVAARIDGIVYVPRWQYTVDGRLLPYLSELIRYLRDPITLTDWIASPCHYLNGNIPLALMLQGQYEQVLRVARDYQIL